MATHFYRFRYVQGNALIREMTFPYSFVPYIPSVTDIVEIETDTGFIKGTVLERRIRYVRNYDNEDYASLLTFVLDVTHRS
ncbi:MAG TPA: hypothetical protein VGN16_21280 [Acidobacteriaceae bacterium]|jgi:hypothetical protein